LIELKEHNKRDLIIDIIKHTLPHSPDITLYFLKTIKSYDLISNLELDILIEITERLREISFPNILYNSLKNAPVIPATQRLVMISIESFGKSIIEKILISKEEREMELDHLQEISNKLNSIEITFFSYEIIKKKSEDYFYKAIKYFYQKKLKKSHHNLFIALKLFRDDFLYYWNFAKVLAKLNQKQNALKFYKRALRLLRMSKLDNKRKIKDDLTLEIKMVKKLSQDYDLKPLISLDKYINNKDYKRS
jgi:tetratricopeptide (TPR) repeat protein